MQDRQTKPLWLMFLQDSDLLKNLSKEQRLDLEKQMMADTEQQFDTQTPAIRSLRNR